MECCSKCQDYRFCDDKAGCCKYCDHYSPEDCLQKTKTRKDRLAEYESFRLDSKEFGDFYTSG